MLHATAKEILQTWFGTIEDDNKPAEAIIKKWFVKDPDFDKLLRDKFAVAHTNAMQGEFDNWGDLADASLALIILLDQFSRNMFRDTPKMFASDHKALKLAKRSIELGLDQATSVWRRSFFYMPLMHSENLEDQEHCIVCMQNLAKAKNTPADKDGGTDFAIQHRDIIKKFGRFPHRNETLGRKSTPEELAFLNTPGSSF